MIDPTHADIGRTVVMMEADDSDTYGVIKMVGGDHVSVRFDNTFHDRVVARHRLCWFAPPPAPEWVTRRGLACLLLGLGGARSAAAPPAARRIRHGLFRRPV